MAGTQADYFTQQFACTAGFAQVNVAFGQLQIGLLYIHIDQEREFFQQEIFRFQGLTCLQLPCGKHLEIHCREDQFSVLGKMRPEDLEVAFSQPASLASVYGSNLC